LELATTRRELFKSSHATYLAPALRIFASGYFLKLILRRTPIPPQNTINPRGMPLTNIINRRITIPIQVRLMKGIDARAAATAAEGAVREGLGLDEAAELVGGRVEGGGPAAAGHGVDLFVDGEAVGCYVEKGTRGEDVDGDGVVSEGEFHD
jgi:hypothetical protein